MLPPGATCAGPLLATCRSAEGVSGAELTAVLFAGFGSVTPAATATVAVLSSAPVALDAIVPLTTNVAVPAAARATVDDSTPAPDAAPQVDPALAVHVHDTATNAGGTASTTLAPTTALGPWFVNTMA